MNVSLSDQALRLVLGQRWPMIPIDAQKRPFVRWKRFQSELPTEQVLSQWAQEFGPRMWAVVTGSLAGIVVADFDGEQGRTLMQRWNLRPHIRTGSGGFHVYLKHPGWRVPTLNAKCSKGTWPWLGLDIRGDGGYAVLLGRNQNGPYRQLRELNPDPFDVLPQELLDLLRKHSSRETVLRPAPTSLRLVERGERVDTERLISRALKIASRQGRNNGGIWLACQLRDNGYNLDEAASALTSYRSRAGETNTKGQRERYTEAEMMASLRGAYSRPPRESWAKPSPQDSEIEAGLAPDFETNG